MQTATWLKDQLLEVFEQVQSAIVDSAPRIVLGLVLVVLALLVAKIAERVLRFLLEKANLEVLLRKAGLADNLRRVGITAPLSRVIPKVTYYLLLFLFARTLADALGLTPISEALGSFLGYVPHLLSALLVALIGSALGQFAGGAVARAAEGSGLEFGRSLGRVTSGLIFFVAVLMAVGQLQLDTDIVRIVTACGFAGLALAFALSFGLGTREVMRSLLAGFYARKVLRPGTQLEIEGHSGTLRAITPTLTVIDGAEITMVVANTRLMEGLTTVRAANKSDGERPAPD